MSRRRVLVSPRVFEIIDDVLGAERGADGHASAGDFVLLDLQQAVEKFAVGFDQLPMVDGLEASRVLLAPGVVVYAFAAFGVLLTDGTIELYSIDIDLSL